MIEICGKCGKMIDGYAATVHTAENWKSAQTETWCEKCCEDHGMCKCDGCSEEFAEEFHMPRIDGGLFCIPCARDKMPECFDECSVFKTGDDFRQIENHPSCLYQVKMQFSEQGTIFYLSRDFTDLEELHGQLRDEADKIASLINEYEMFPPVYLGDREYQDSEEEYDEDDGQIDFNLKTFREWMEELVEENFIWNAVIQAEIITRTLLPAKYFQAEILDSSEEVWIGTTFPYSKIEAVYDELRGTIDLIGPCIAASIDECSYLGNVDYEEGHEFNDDEMQWSFNKKTLSEWIECAIKVGNYNGPLVDIRIKTNEILDKYVPKHEAWDKAENIP